MTTMNAASLLPLEMTRHLHRAPPPPPGLLPPMRTRSPPPPNFGLCGIAGAGGRVSPSSSRPRPASTSLMSPLGGGGGDKQPGAGGAGGSGSSGAGSFLGFHGAGGGPTAANSADNNTCRLIEYRSAQVAAFNVDGRELICLPQAFELFLKHLVGGLHTVYTKLKRLDITPVVCNVEQVRILRGLGAIQPGVNRCKLISPREFDVLYEDCTNSSARPGRPPKRTSSFTSTEVALEQLKRSKFTNFTDFYAQNRLIDAKKALSGFGGNASGPGGASYLPYLDFKKSPLFSGCYNYPPQMPPHLPFIPFGYHGMMNLAVAGNHLHAALQRRGEDLQRFSMTAARPQATDSATPSQRSDEQDVGTKMDSNDVSEDTATVMRHRHHHMDSYLTGDDPDKPLNLETNKTAARSPRISSPTHTPVESRDSVEELKLARSNEQHQQQHENNLELTDDVTTYEASDDVRSQSSADLDDVDDDEDDGVVSCCNSDNQSVNSSAEKSAQCHAGDPQPFDGHPTNAATALLPDQYSVETLLANVQALLKLAMDSARHRHQQAAIKTALLQKQLRKEKRTRRELEQRLSAAGRDADHGQTVLVRSPPPDGVSQLRASSISDVLTPTYQHTGLQAATDGTNELALQNGYCYTD